MKGDQRATQMLIKLMRDLDILKPQEALRPPAIHIHFTGPREISTNDETAHALDWLTAQTPDNRPLVGLAAIFSGGGT